MSLPQELKTQELDEAEAYAIQALEQGQASEHQQKLALAAIVKKICRTHDQSYMPGDTHATAVMEGRRFVGLKLLRVINTKVSNE